MGTTRRRLVIMGKIIKKGISKIISMEYMKLEPTHKLYINIILGNLLIWVPSMYSGFIRMIGVGMSLPLGVKTSFSVIGIFTILITYSKHISITQFEVYRKYINKKGIWLLVSNEGGKSYRYVRIDDKFLKVNDKDNTIKMNLGEVLGNYSVIGGDVILNKIQLMKSLGYLDDRGMDYLLENMVENYTGKDIGFVMGEEIYKINSREENIDSILS